MDELERDMPECEPEKVQHDEHEPSTYELAEAELQAQENNFVRHYE
jgi:hypothetical protein